LSYAVHWAALATQIKGLLRAGELYGLFQSHRDADSYGAEKFLREQCVALVQLLEQFQRDFVDSLPSTAVARIDRFLGITLVQTVKNNATDSVRGVLVGLAAFEAEITFLLAGRQEQIRARSERTLLHLQRILAVDPDVSAR
jgi:hypothetical protein